MVFLNVVYSTKNLSIQDRAVHMKEEKNGLILFFLFLEVEREIGFYGTATLALVGLRSPASVAFAKTMRSWVLMRGSEGGYIQLLKIG
jgi:hypothetical protein